VALSTKNEFERGLQILRQVTLIDSLAPSTYTYLHLPLTVTRIQIIYYQLDDSATHSQDSPSCPFGYIVHWTRTNYASSRQVRRYRLYTRFKFVYAVDASHLRELAIPLNVCEWRLILLSSAGCKMSNYSDML